jgi:hypothetical protein
MPKDTVVEFRSEDEEGAVLRLGYEPLDSDSGTLTAEIRAEGLTCDGNVLSARGDGPRRSSRVWRRTGAAGMAPAPGMRSTTA